MWVWIGCWNRSPWNSSMILMTKNYIYITKYTHYTTQNVTERESWCLVREIRERERVKKEGQAFQNIG